MTRLHHFCLAMALGLGLGQACSWTPAPELPSNLPTRRQLVRNSNQQGQWLWVYCPTDPSRDADYRAALQSAVGPDNETRVVLRSCRQTPDSLLGAQPTAFIGAHLPDAWRQRLNQWLPLQLHQAGFEFAHEQFDGGADFLKLFYYPNPWNPNLAMHLVLGNHDDQLLQHLTDKYSRDWTPFFWSSWGYEVFRDNQTRFLGFFADSTWQLNLTTDHFAFAGAPQLRHEDNLLRLWTYDDANLTPSLLDSLATHYTATYHRIRQFTGGNQPLRVDWYCYPTPEAKGMRLQDNREAQSHPSLPVVHLVENGDFRGHTWGEQHRPLLRHWLGEPAAPVLELGLATYFADHWGAGHGWRHWVARLHHSQNLPSLAELFDPQVVNDESPLVLAPAAAALVDFLIDSWGRDTFLARYPTWTPPPPHKVAGWQTQWQAYLDTQYPAPSLAPVMPVPRQYQRGYTFAHEGYRIYNGYGGRLADASVQALGQLHVNALAIVPYSFMRSPQQPAPIPVVRSAGSENDEAVRYAFYLARRQGMYTLLKPQIWVRGSWPGEIDLADEEAWDQFFVHYYRWMRHYVLLAEMEQMDALCVGTELTQATLQHPQRWREMIGRWRGLYRGVLTYAANWGPEFEQLSFWDELDVIGLNGYYPLSADEAPTDAQLQAGVAAWLAKAKAVHQRANRPVWLTEIGYRSVEGAWQGPHEEAAGRPVNPTAQARCFAALFAASAQEDWLTGMFIWKWPSYLDYQEDQGAGFNPIGKPAAAVVSDNFLKIKQIRK